MERSVQRKGLINWLVLLVFGAASTVVARYANSATGLMTAVFMGVGFLIAAVSYFQMRLEDREGLEQLEFDELKKTAASATLFTEQAADTFPARRAREQFERFFVPAFTILLFLLEAAAVYLLWRQSGQAKPLGDAAAAAPVFSGPLPASGQQATVAMALYGLFALVCFQFGKYSAVLARLEQQRLLRPQASALLLAALLSLLAALVAVADWADYPQVDAIVARVLLVVLALVAAENLLGLVFEVYRPRLKGQAEHPLYESRLIGLLSQPGGLITTAAQALDYQFGFKVSETWFYRFLERALAWLVLLQLGLLGFASMFVFIEPGEQGLLERFGRPVAGRAVLGPGPHLKLPWPIDKVYRFPTDRVQDFTVGIVHEEKQENERVLLWAKAHAKEEFSLLVASRSEGLPSLPEGEQTVPVNLLAVNVPVHYQVRDLRAFACEHANAGDLLQKLANGEVTRYLVSVDVDEIMAAGRQKAAADLRQRIQARADALNLGVKILFVGLHGIHPPVKVAPDFEQVIGAIQDREATNLYAKAYLAERVPRARAEAAVKVNEAEVYRIRQSAAAAAAAARFTNQMAAYQASPEVYQWRTYLETLSQAIASARKYVVTITNTHGVASLNLEDKVRPDLTDVALPPSPKKPEK
jgi:membrane protease subunit HflK